MDFLNKSKKILKPRTTPNSGYLHFHTTIKGKDIETGIHRLVAECWIPIPKRYLDAGMTMKDLVVNHLDFDVTNNSADNLEWCTPEENMQYSIDAGHITGESLKRYYKDHPPYWKGKHLSDETIEKRSNLQKEYYKTHDHPMLGKRQSDMARKKMSENHRDYTGCNHPRAHKDKVLMVRDSTENVFENLDKASEYLSKERNISNNTARNSILRVCRGERKVAYKANWYFI